LGSLPGIERVRAQLRGLVPRPPLCRLLGYRLTQVGSGTATLTMPVSPCFQDYTGNIDVRVPAEEALALAEPGEILVSGGLRDLVAGSGLRFVPRGRHELKGVDGEWEIFGVVD
jgi:class 3 adenylate cyclase